MVDGQLSQAPPFPGRIEFETHTGRLIIVKRVRFRQLRKVAEQSWIGSYESVAAVANWLVAVVPHLATGDEPNGSEAPNTVPRHLPPLPRRHHRQSRPRLDINEPGGGSSEQAGGGDCREVQRGGKGERCQPRGERDGLHQVHADEVSDAQIAAGS